MKTFLLSIVCILLNFAGHGQLSTAPNSNECATTLPGNYGKWRNTVIQNNVANLKHDICVNKKFSIVFYVIADSNGANTVPPSDIVGCINKLDSAFSPICVSFMNCSTVVIPHHPFNRWTEDTIEPVVRNMYWTNNVINIYLPDEIVGDAAGYSALPGLQGSERMVIEKGAINSTTAIHEMGHFFGLPHTWAEIGTPVTPAPPGGTDTYEFVRRTNCYTNGDGFCDTEADCYPLNKNLSAPCEQQAGAKDGYQDYYTPPVDNYMTYFRCRIRFTQEQRNFMANTAMTSLLYLH